MREIIKTNTEYSKWIKEVSLRFRNSQIKAATKVNREMLLFYWSIGHDISENYNEVKYGKSFFKNLFKNFASREIGLTQSFELLYCKLSAFVRTTVFLKRGCKGSDFFRTCKYFRIFFA